MLLCSSCGKFTVICVRLLSLSNYFHVQPRCRDCCVQSDFLLACFLTLPLCNQTQTESKMVSGKIQSTWYNYRGGTNLLLTGFYRLEVLNVLGILFFKSVTSFSSITSDKNTEAEYTRNRGLKAASWIRICPSQPQAQATCCKPLPNWHPPPWNKLRPLLLLGSYLRARVLWGDATLLWSAAWICLYLLHLAISISH